MRTQRKHFVKVKGGMGWGEGGTRENAQYIKISKNYKYLLFCLHKVSLHIRSPPHPPPQYITLAVLLHTHCNQTK